MQYKKWLNGSAYTRRLPEGCIHCARGSKLVLLVTGKCRSSCYYCPLSFKKRGKAVVYADEKRALSDSDILEEASLIHASGTGITGGDPLIQPPETARLIKLLKRRFGRKHHIHLYTSCSEVKSISLIAKAGLDEIRFHPPVKIWNDLDKSEFAKAFRISADLGMDVGIEIPSLPGHESDISSLLISAKEFDLDFVNINELEFSYTNWRALRKRGFAVKDDVSNAVKGSEKIGLKILRNSPSGLSVHYCSASFKDGIQLRRRIMRRAKSIRRPLDILTEDGTLVMGVIETRRPQAILAELSKDFDIPKRFIQINKELGRVELASWILEEIASDLDLDAYIIEEYPTADRLEVEREQVSRQH